MSLLQFFFTKTLKFGDEIVPTLSPILPKNHSNDVAEELVNVTGIHGGKEKKRPCHFVIWLPRDSLKIVIFSDGPHRPVHRLYR